MRSLTAITICELQALASNARPSTHSQVLKAIDSYYECLKLLFDQVLTCIITPIAES